MRAFPFPRGRHHPHTLTILAVILTLALPVAAQPVDRRVDLVGEFSDVAATASGHPYGFTVTLWSYGDGFLGTLAYFAGAEGYSNTSLIRDVELNRDTGAIVFRAKLFLSERRHDFGDWGQAVESVEFVGTLTADALVGDFTLQARAEGERTYFEDAAVTLHRLAVDGRPTSYRDYPTWLAAHEGELGTRKVVGSAPVIARPPRSLHVGLSGGLIRSQGDDTEFFNTGGTQVSINVLYTVHSRISFGARIGYSRFAPNELAVRDAVLPIGVTEAQLIVPENGYLIQFVPMVRVSSGNVTGDRVVSFVQLGVGYYYVNLKTPYSLAWIEGARQRVENGFIGSDGHFGGASAGVGFSLRLSQSSRLEVAPEYHHLFGKSDVSYFGVMMQFRMEFLHE